MALVPSWLTLSHTSGVGGWGGGKMRNGDNFLNFLMLTTWGLSYPPLSYQGWLYGGSLERFGPAALRVAACVT